jgi:hypothetical protein
VDAELNDEANAGESPAQTAYGNQPSRDSSMVNLLAGVAGQLSWPTERTLRGPHGVGFPDLISQADSGRLFFLYTSVDWDDYADGQDPTRSADAVSALNLIQCRENCDDSGVW